ncbi:MAG: hypothetical protein Q8K98_01395 [Bacteroidota bacterium]|nr:hypothetical protein [Bacteroidota bacterium]
MLTTHLRCRRQLVEKKLLQIFIGLTVFSFLCVSAGSAQSLEERLNKFGKKFGSGYVNPFVTAFGANLNSGLYHSADVETGIDVYVGAKFTFALIPASAQEFDADLSELNSLRGALPPYQTPVKTATFFGNKGTKVPGSILPGDTLQLPNGTNLKAVPVAVPHIMLGNIFGTRMMLRYLPAMKIDKYGELSFMGIGFQHNVGQWLPAPLPFDWSAHVMYQNMKIKPVVEATAFSLGTEISKTFMFATIYGGVAYESATMNFKFNWTPPPPLTQTPKEVKFDLSGDNTMRLTAGFALKLLFFHISADYSYAKQPVATLGLGIAI